MKILCLDVETQISNKGNPFDTTNKCVCIGLKWIGGEYDCYIKYDSFEKLQFSIDKADMLVGFNIKFDLHWLRRVGLTFENKRIWDCQIGEFILNNQKTPYPSLNDAALKYGFNLKLDVIKKEYWDKGIDTDAIPREILSEYLEQDLLLTEQVFTKQRELFKEDGRFKIFKLQCLDLVVLQEMEYNGIVFNIEKALEKAQTIEKELNEISSKINGFVGGVPININSNDHLSALLYGGSILEDIRIPVGIFKTGAKQGQIRHKILTKEYKLPRLIEPIKGTETEKSKKKSLESGCEASLWEVNETTLRKLKLNKEAKLLVSYINKYSELEKLRGTYLIGYCELIKKMNWKHNVLHGTLNQCVAITGRLSSTRPNLQNADPTTKTFMESWYL